MTTPNQPPVPWADLPALSPDQRLNTVPERLALALDARDAEQALQAQWIAQSLDAMKPEIERLAREALERQAHERWRAQAMRYAPD
jgi:hypothetical protein